MVDSKFTIILDLKIADTDAGYILQWDTYYFKFAVYQTEDQKIQFIWIDKGLLKRSLIRNREKFRKKACNPAKQVYFLVIKG